jgi:hypothetical protein
MAPRPQKQPAAASGTATPGLRGNPNWSIDEWRLNLDRAQSAARDSWETYISDLALAYSSAYQKVKDTLKHIESAEKAEMENAELIWTVILPAVGGGFLAGLASLTLKDALKKTGYKWAAHSLSIDTLKTVAGDLGKAKIRQVGKDHLAELDKEEILDKYRNAISENPWAPPSVEPQLYGEACRNQLLHTMNQIKSDLVVAMQGPPQEYRSLMIGLYNSPFIWQAPQEDDLAKWKSELWKPLEVFLWTAWANQLNTKYWLERIMRTADLDYAPDTDDLRQIGKLDGVLERLLACGVSMDFITMHHRPYQDRIGDVRQYHPAGVVFNVLWVRHLASHYQNTFLGMLLNQIDPHDTGPKKKKGTFVNLEFRPGSIRLM